MAAEISQLPVAVASGQEVTGATTTVYPVWFGGSASSMAVFATHPLELVKVRMQIPHENGLRVGMLRMFFQITRTEGPSGLYKGSEATIQELKRANKNSTDVSVNAVTYGTTRFALYEVFKQNYQSYSGRSAGLAALIPAAAASGFFGGIVGCPADIANVRMQGDAGLSDMAQRRYKNVINAWQRMVKEEGWASLMKGWWPNSVRAGLMTSSQLASYDALKLMIMSVSGAGDGTPTHLASSVGASLVATTVCSPVDVVKVRMMSGGAGRGVSIGTLVRKLTREEGVRWMWRGWTPSFVRLGPQTVATFLLLEQHRKVYSALYAMD